MQSLSELLLTYHIPGVRSAEVRRICAEEVSFLTGYALNSKQLQYKDDCLYLSVPPIIKSALILKQQEFSNRLTSRGITLKTVK
jgi:hypothetical protein